MRTNFHAISLGLLSLLFISAGINHFVSPDIYLKIMPDYLPWPLALVYLSGFFEALGGVGLVVSKLRRAAGWGLIAVLVAVLVAVFPANVDMLVHAEQFPAIPFWALLARLPLQGVIAQFDGQHQSAEVGVPFLGMTRLTTPKESSRLPADDNTHRSGGHQSARRQRRS